MVKIQAMHKLRAILALPALALFLAGCMSIPPAQEFSDSGQASVYQPYFELSGRISVRQGQRGDFGQLRWTRAKDTQKIVLLSPLGQTVAEISQSDDQPAVLRIGSERRTAASFEALAHEALGASVPIGDIAYWIQGLTDTQSGEASIGQNDVAGRPQRLSHAGWEIHIEGYRRLGEATIASRLTAVKDDSVIKIVIDEWKPLP